MHKVRRWHKHPLFIATKQKQIKSNLNFINQYKIDCINILKAHWITYNTLENSKFSKKKVENPVQIWNWHFARKKIREDEPVPDFENIDKYNLTKSNYA